MPLRRVVVLALAALLAPVLPTLASSGGPAVVPAVVRTAALTLGVTTADLLADEELVGVTWAAGRPAVQVRWRTAAGWTAWERPDVDTDVPDGAERTRARPGTEPLWRPTGAHAVQVRLAGAARDVRLVRVGDGPARGGGGGLAQAHAADDRALLRGFHSRADWGADESMRRQAPSYAAGVKAVVVHHTAGRNDYAPADVPRMIRADYAYHVQGRGWNDLGYNLVVDRFGRIWEGRAGGLGRATIGAHAAGFNTGTLGVSLLGDMTSARPAREVVLALGRVAAYAGGTWRFDPKSSVVLTSGGSPKYQRGTKVRLARVQGHRDTGRTTCPGSLYDALPQIRELAALMLGPAPVVREVTVTGAPVRAPHPVVITGRLSRAAPWRVEVRDAGSAIVAEATGEGTTARLEWNGLQAPGGSTAPPVVPALPGSYRWTVTADNGFHRPSGRSGDVEVALPLVAVGS